MALTTQPLAERFGLEVMDVDLANLDESTFAQIYRLWQDEPLLLFRRQSLRESALVNYSRGFGDLDLIVRDDMHSPTHPEVIYITGLRRPDGSALGGLGTYEVHWHHDQIYRERPASGSIFYAMAVPDEGGETSWCNTELGYSSLPEPLREKLVGQKAVCKYGLKPSASFQRDFDGNTARVRELNERTPPARHPIVLTNPANGRQSLYLDPNKTFQIGDLDEPATAALLNEIFDHVIDDRHIYTHTWQNGDVVMWDNARLMHRRDAFDETLPRLAKRTTIFLRADDFAVPEPHLGR
ncbi:MAG: TauD/TfdA family dioxygenase [Gammaproteobacteria bacterium]|nr:TauD/TfdA family dioxygenase [Gammaproteobacteria bacterium]